MDEVLPYPFLAIVGQAELKMALVLALINPQIGGVLLIGPYGVGKTTAVRGLLDVMPTVEVEETDEAGNPVKRRRPMRLIELPLNARMEDVVGGINERVALEQQRVLLEEGVLARAHRNVLYIDEVNLLPIPVLDGGYLMIFTVEAIRRRKLSPEAMMRVQFAGLVIVLMIFVTVFSLDIYKLLTGKLIR